jgi:hypothetical protein
MDVVSDMRIFEDDEEETPKATGWKGKVKSVTSAFF